MRKRNVVAAAVALVLGLVLVACAQPTPEVRVEELIVKETVIVEQEVVVTPTLTTGGTLVVAYPFSPSTLNPLVNRSSPTSAIVPQIFDRLIVLDKDSDLKPGLAESWELSDDGMTLTFHLRKNIKWHDGEPFTSADVKWFFESLVMNTPNRFGGQMETLGFEGVDTPDDYTAIFRASEQAWLPYIFGFLIEASVLPKHILESVDPAELDKSEFNVNPIGTGPWKLESFLPGERVTLVANEDYYLGRPRLDRLVFNVILEPEAAALAYEAGEVDMLHEWYAVKGLTSQLDRIKALPDTEVIEYSYWNMLRFMFNFREEAIAKYPWVADVNVRRAIAHAIDKHTVVARVYSGAPVLVAHQLFTATTPWAWNPDVPMYEYDPQKAEKLLDEAGYPRGEDGIRFSAPLPYTPGTAPDSLIAVIGAMLEEVGIIIEPEAMESGAYSSQTWRSPNGYGDIPWTIFTLTGGPHPDGLRVQYHIDFTPEKGGRNAVFYDNPDVNRLLDEARSESDPTKQLELWFEVERILMEDLPAVPLYNSFLAQVWNTSFGHDEDVSRPIHYIGPYYQVFQETP
jgi:peptide/nickel transport system substrate-binding protein